MMEEFIKWLLAGAGVMFTLAKGFKEIVSLIDMCVDLKRKLANRGNDDEQR